MLHWHSTYRRVQNHIRNVNKVLTKSVNTFSHTYKYHTFCELSHVTSNNLLWREKQNNGHQYISVFARRSTSPISSTATALRTTCRRSRWSSHDRKSTKSRCSAWWDVTVIQMNRTNRPGWPFRRSTATDIPTSSCSYLKQAPSCEFAFLAEAVAVIYLLSWDGSDSSWVYFRFWAG